jgi:hypothetical protein
VATGNPPVVLVNDVADAVIVIADDTTATIGTSSSNTVSFTGPTGSLVLSDPGGFTGQIVGFTGTAPDAAHSDTVDLVGIDFNSAHFAESFDTSHGVLTVTDGVNTASLTFDDFNATLDFASDGHGGTLITDPPATSSAADASAPSSAASEDDHDAPPNKDADTFHAHGNISFGAPDDGNGIASRGFAFMSSNDRLELGADRTSTQSHDAGFSEAHNNAGTPNQMNAVSIGGLGNDHFVFAPGVGADTIVNFNSQRDTIELDHFANAQTVQELQSLITSDAHGDAFINLGNHNSVTVEGLTAAQLQANLQNLVHLH